MYIEECISVSFLTIITTNCRTTIAFVCDSYKSLVFSEKEQKMQKRDFFDLQQTQHYYYSAITESFADCKGFAASITKTIHLSFPSQVMRIFRSHSFLMRAA